MKLPMYCIVGTLPVKAVRTDDGGMDVLSYDKESREFVRNMNQLPVFVFGEREHTRVSKADFDAYVEDLNQGKEPRWYENFKAIE